MIFAENLTVDKENPGEQRRGACGMAHQMLLKNATTEELVTREADRLAVQYPERGFRLMFDGIAGFALLAGAQTVCRGDFYAVERMFRQDAFVFRKWLEEQCGTIENA